MTRETRKRIGVIVESDELPAWQAAVVESIAKLRFAEVVLIFVVKSRRSVSQHIARVVAQWIANRRRKPEVDALAPVSAASVCQPTETLTQMPVDRVTVATIETAIQRRHVDLLLDLADCALQLAPGSVPRLGVWYYSTDGCPFSPADGSLVGFKEVLRRDASLETALRIRMPGHSSDRIACQTRSAVHARSLAITRNEHLWKCSCFVARALQRLNDSDDDTFLAALPAPPFDPPRPPDRNLVTSLARYAAWRVRRKLSGRHKKERWILLWDENGTASEPHQMRQLVPPPGRFWADPHAIAVDGGTHVYFEDASCETGTGHIALMSRGEDGNFGAPAPVIQRPYHLSYPFVFRWRGELYMIPESAENCTVELYHCTRFPGHWNYMYNLLVGIRAYDATLVEHEGRWWMFANVSERAGCSTWDELCIFYADSPVSRQWQAHRSNPVISDVSRARPAGAFFTQNGALIRPSQDSTGRYGRALNFNRVDELSETRYCETTVRSVAPGHRSGFSGIHSFSIAGNLTFYDAIHQESR